MTHICTLSQIVLLATVAYASAGLYSGYGGLYGYGGYGYGGYGLGHGIAAIAPSVGYAHAPVATSYANTIKVSKVSSQTVGHVTGLYDTRRQGLSACRRDRSRQMAGANSRGKFPVSLAVIHKRALAQNEFSRNEVLHYYFGKIIPGDEGRRKKGRGIIAEHVLREN